MTEAKEAPSEAIAFWLTAIIYALKTAFKYCVDSTIVGNYLTTTGFSPEDDKGLIKKIGRKILNKL